ncbi:MAG TPA: HD domain-containing phosphohydrolase [Tepidisphaeraceae bacterium]|nr:HD domain-containing phosphohydrolase [Tepidisphaeraceae bacterium]
MLQWSAESSPSTAAIPTAALENLAARFRASGLCLFLFRVDGSHAYHDAEAGEFFSRYVSPILRCSQPSAPLKDVRQLFGQSNPPEEIALWTSVPGVLLSAIPFIERRQLVGVLVLAGRSATPGASDQVSSWCARLGLDPQWFADQTETLQAYDQAEMRRQAGLLLAMVRDQVKLSSLESELNGLSNQLSNTYEELTLIYEISRGMRINRQAHDFFKNACLDVLGVLGVGGLGVALCGQHAHRHHPVLFGQLAMPQDMVSRLAEALLPQLCHRKSPLLVNDLQKDAGFAWLAGQARNLLAVPMQRQDDVLGCYFALDKPNGDFDSQDSKLLTSIANESAIYLENAMLFDDVHGLMMGLLHSLTSAVDAKDAYTHGHSERVAALGRELATEAGLGDALAQRVYMAGLLHDVGKIGVPESVLQKTGRLTPEEFEQMKKHPQIGARILADVKQVKDLIPGVLHHHERYDGNGYPHGLSGENIPLFGRLICLADCFDAMTSNRTYRKAMPLEVALTEIRRCSGTQFDPALTEAFLRIGADRLRELVLRQQKLAADAMPPQAAA